jgi:N-acetylmuramoyl-L-alanine amidase
MPWIECRAGNCPGRAPLAPTLVQTVALLFALQIGIAFGAVAQQPPPIPVPPPPLATPDLPAIPAPPNAIPVRPAFSVVIDAAHGGGDIGARIADNLLEKDLTLGFSVRLRSALTARGIAVVTTREADIDLRPDQRAGVANHAQASACLVLHATTSGSGVHLFTSSLAPATPGPMESPIPWQTAQAGWVTRSLRLSSEINSALGQEGIPATLGSTSLEPLDHLGCPAVAIEIAPLAASPANKAAPLADTKYHQRILDALVAAILAWSTDWRQQP